MKGVTEEEARRRVNRLLYEQTILAIAREKLEGLPPAPIWLERLIFKSRS